MHVRRFAVSLTLILSTLTLHTTVIAQAGVALTGRLVNSLSGDPIPGAAVQIDELGRMTTSGAEGTFRFENVPPGTYHVSIHSAGYSTRRTEVTVAAAAQIDVTVDPELHFQEQTTVTGDLRSQFEVYQPTPVLDGQ